MMNQKNDVVRFNIRLVRLQGGEWIGEAVIMEVPDPIIGISRCCCTGLNREKWMDLRGNKGVSSTRISD